MLTPEERRRRLNAYKRRYEKEHPEKVKQWRRNSILRTADRIRAEQAQSAHGLHTERITGGDPGEGGQDQSSDGEDPGGEE